MSVANDAKQDEIIENDFDEDDHSRIITAHDCSDSDESEEEIVEEATPAKKGSLLSMMKTTSSGSYQALTQQRRGY